MKSADEGRASFVMTASQFARSIKAHFDDSAATYDQVFTDTLIGRIERNAVWRELRRVFHSGQRILELNCGTGVDAVYLAENGVRVLACDIAPKMIEVARQRPNSKPIQELIDFRVLATEHIAALAEEGPFDGAFSNFAGLNCVEDLSLVSKRLGPLLKPGARVLLCMAGSFVPLEIAWHLAHGNPRKALRRFKLGSTANRRTEDPGIKVQYPSVRTMARMFAPEFRLREWKGIGVVLPPAYFESWARRFPRVVDGLARSDDWLGRCPGLRGIAGHVLLHFERAGKPELSLQSSPVGCNVEQGSNRSFEPR